MPPKPCTATRSACEAVLSSAFRMGQSATPSEPSRMRSVSRVGAVTEPESRWSRVNAIGPRDAAARHGVVDEQAELAAVAVAEPADARGQAGELHGLARGGDPVRDRLAREVLEDDVVDGVDVVRVAGDREPAERADALAEERPDVALGEHAHVEGVLDAEQLRARAQAVAVLEHLGAAALELEHRADVVDERGVGAPDQLVAIAAAQLVGLGRRHAARDVAADRIDRRLVGDDVGRDAALEQGVHHVGDVGHEADRDGLAALLGAEHRASASSRSSLRCCR